MRKWTALAALLAACSHGSGPGARLPGAAEPRQAVVDFLSAVKAQDLQAMSSVWGDARGPARDRFERKELEQRLVIMQSCYEHERYRIIGETTGTGGKRVINVALTRGNRNKNTNFEVLKGPSSRYFVNVSNADFSEMLRDFCPR